jgi:hypothetical protein
MKIKISDAQVGPRVCVCRPIHPLIHSLPSPQADAPNMQQARWLPVHGRAMWPALAADPTCACPSLCPCPRRTRALHKLAKFIKQQGPAAAAAGAAAGRAAAAEPSQHHHLVQVLLDVAVPLVQQVRGAACRATCNHQQPLLLAVQLCSPGPSPCSCLTGLASSMQMLRARPCMALAYGRQSHPPAGHSASCAAPCLARGVTCGHAWCASTCQSSASASHTHTVRACTAGC